MPTWEELGRPTGTPPVGQRIGYEGGTYERLDTNPVSYRILDADGRDVSGLLMTGKSYDPATRAWVKAAPTPEEVRAALRVATFDRQRLNAEAKSRWRKAMQAVPGCFHLGTEQISGFDEATPQQREAIRSALQSWKDDIFSTETGVEPNVNAASRGRMPHTAKTRADAEALDAAFELSRTSRAITTHRGVGDGRHILPADWQTRDLTGLEWTEIAFSATSVNKQVAREYVGEVAERGFGMTIPLSKGSPAIALPDAPGSLDAEGELILPRKPSPEAPPGLTYRVVKDHGFDRQGMRWLDVEIVITPANPAG